MENDTKNESAFLNDAEKIAIIGELSCIENVTALMQAKVKNGTGTHDFLSQKVKELANYVSDLEKMISRSVRKVESGTANMCCSSCKEITKHIKSESAFYTHWNCSKCDTEN